MIVMMHSLHDPLNDQPHCQHIDFGLVLVRLQKVYLREVHAHRLWNEGLEELHHEGQRDALTLRGASRSKF